MLDRMAPHKLMMEQLSLNWDIREGERRKEAGRNIAAAAKNPLLTKARELAVQIAKRQGAVNADEVVFAMECEGIDIHALGSAAGSLFRGGKFEWTGEFVMSSRVHAHRNLLRVWRLKGD